MVRQLTCLVPGCNCPAENAHLPGAGGMGIKGPPETIVNLCAWHHTLESDSLHELGSVERFDTRWCTDLVASAAELERAWQERRASLEEASMDG